MSQFNYLNEMNSLLNMDGPLTKGPTPRWQKRAMETSITANSSSTANVSKASTPGRVKQPSGAEVQPQGKKTPSAKTHSRSAPNTPHGHKAANTSCAADRFIPSRSASNFDLGHLRITNDEEDEVDSPSQQQIRQTMSKNLHGVDIEKERIFSFQKKAPTAPEGFVNPNRVLYSQSITPASVKGTSRYIPQAPDRVLDAPNFIDDFYLNLLDWSDTNVVAAALGNSVYLWNAETGKTDQLLELQGSDYVCSLAWIQDGNVLAVGTSLGLTELWDCSQNRRLRILAGHEGRVGAVAWNNYVLTTGSYIGKIINNDVRERDHHINHIDAHTREVCGLKWSPDGRYLASGGNDNVLNIWPLATDSYHSETTALYSFTAHQAAVKALDWCPWQRNILASGGGTADRYIRIWNIANGTCISETNAKSQVCSLLWAKNYKELISCHGFSKNQLTIWKYPTMAKVAELTGHTQRVLHMVISPDGNSVMSAGADETLRLWKCFVKEAHKKTKQAVPQKEAKSILKQSIR